MSAMNKFKKSQVLVLIVLALLLLITPFLPSSLRPAYLYFIFNFLIISLGAEAGLLSASSGPLEDTVQSASVTQKSVIKPQEGIPEERDAAASTNEGSDITERNEKKLKVVEMYSPAAPSTNGGSDLTERNEKKLKIVEMYPAAACSTNGGSDIPESNEKKLKVVETYPPAAAKKMKKCASVPSLFFIGSEETVAEEAMDEEVEAEEEIGGVSEQELCAKADAFIGNFYKQLKMQREESWKKIHEFYQIAV